VKRLVRSETYARTRLINAGLFVLLGAVVVVRTFGVVGFAWPAVPGCVLGAAMVALGAVRIRDYLAARARP
jgi:hypothetical protein